MVDSNFSIRNASKIEDIGCKNTDGKFVPSIKVATYIPQLARYSPNKWGVSLCTVDGQRYSNGDVQVPFSLQSVSKPLTYAMALDELSPSVVHKYVGQEPNKPHNPMINAGAICVSSLLKQDLDLADRFAYATSVLNRLTGGEHLAFNNSVFLSERATADRNFALAYYMSEKRVGLPAKSGVSGVILIVVPNKMGFCTWSPALDKWGNSMRGVYFAEKIESRASEVVELLFSAYTCDVSALRRFALSDLDMDQADYDGRTALHIGSAEGHEPVVNFLINKCKCNPNIKDRFEAMNQYNANEKIDRSFAAIDSVAYHDIALKTVSTVEDASEYLEKEETSSDQVIHNVDNAENELNGEVRMEGDENDM
ncbi:GLSK-like protein [Mya arenaria]|uniref:glutaminase n=1 Tax=Mya arenaria TaxID=6604 RepID=A0ABY7F6R9_MYAAR|nr:GLSK-like protein [Mya arenaria]